MSFSQNFLTTQAQCVHAQESMLIDSLKKIMYILLTTVKIQKHLQVLAATNQLSDLENTKKKKTIQHYSDHYLEENDITITPNFQHAKLYKSISFTYLFWCGPFFPNFSKRYIF